MSIEALYFFWQLLLKSPNALIFEKNIRIILGDDRQGESIVVALPRW
jgi:hypothetical protein